MSMAAFYNINGWFEENILRSDKSIHRENKDFSISRGYHEKCLKIATDNNMIKVQASCYHNIARTYLAESNWKMFESNTNKSLEINKVLFDGEPDDDQTSVNYMMFATYYNKRKMYKEMEEYINKSLLINKKIGHYRWIMDNYIMFSELYLFYYKDINKAKEYFVKVEKMSKKLELWQAIAYLCEIFSNYYKSKDDEKFIYYKKLNNKYIKLHKGGKTMSLVLNKPSNP